MIFRKIGTTAAEVEWSGDQNLIRILHAAQNRHGIKTGIRGSDEGIVLITALFYPTERFFIARCEPDGTVIEDARLLDKAGFERTWSLLDGPPSSLACHPG